MVVYEKLSQAEKSSVNLECLIIDCYWGDFSGDGASETARHGSRRGGRARSRNGRDPVRDDRAGQRPRPSDLHRRRSKAGPVSTTSLCHGSLANRPTAFLVFRVSESSLAISVID